MERCKRKWNIGWGVIAECNMKCQFCYSKQRREKDHRIRLEDWVRFIDENHQNINTINYGTGENTMDNEWFELIDHIRTKYPEIRQALTTNGFLSHRIKDSGLHRITTNAIDEIDVSLDFADEKLHGRFRGQPQAYKWAIETLRYCKDYHKSATIVFLGSRVNLSEENIRGLFEIGAQYDAKLRMNMFRPTEGIHERSRQFIVDADTVIKIITFISENYKVLSINDSLFSPLLTGRKVDDPSGVNSLRILADGSITPSTYLIKDEYMVGNITESKCLDSLEQKIQNIVYNAIPDECEPCVIREQCKGGVIDRRYLWHGTLKKRDPYCQGVIMEDINPDKFVKIADEIFESVHDGYLPTMFFKN